MESIIELQHISKHFAQQTVLKDLSLTVKAGETVGIVGPNGSGKSVLFQILCGLLRPDSGHVQIAGQELGTGRDFPENVGILINAPGFIALETGLRNLQYLAGIRHVVGDAEIREAMRKVGLDPEDRTRVEHYSQGMKQKLGLAQAIMENQEILVLDEPFNALDQRTCREVKELLQLLKAEGRTILLTSHRDEDLEGLCDVVYTLHKGALQIAHPQE